MLLRPYRIGFRWEGKPGSEEPGAVMARPTKFREFRSVSLPELTRESIRIQAHRLLTRVALARARRNQARPLNQEGQSQPFNEGLVFQFFPPERGDARHSQVSPG